MVLFDSHWNPAVDLQAVYRCYRYGQTKQTYCYRLLAEGSMEQKIYSRAAAKTSLSDLVVDQKNPERSFTREEMNLLRVEDTWVSCETCKKWRMLPPDISAEVVEALPEQWYCNMNTFDPDRSSCDAKERDAAFMVQYYARQARHAAREAAMEEAREAGGEAGGKAGGESEVVVESQASQVSQVGVANGELADYERKHTEYTSRDQVLQVLLERAEMTKAASTVGNDTTPSGKMTWVSKWDFTFARDDEKLESDEEEEIVLSPRKRSPQKRSPKKKKTPTKSDVNSESTTNEERSPRKKVRRSPRSSPRNGNDSSGEKRKAEEGATHGKAVSKSPPEKKAKANDVVDLTLSDSD